MGLFSFFKKEKVPAATPLRLYNTLSGELEVFEPLSSREVRMYNCGPTVYGPQHIGNMRAAVFADTIRRTLTVWGFKVKQVINITDFGHLSGGDVGDDESEDKMTQGLKREGMKLTLENMRKLAEKYTEIYFEDISALNVDRSKITFPRASDYIPEQIALVKALEEKGYAYEIEGGVYYDTTKFKGYGKLGNINLEGQQEGARVDENKEKKNPRDFVLWKKSEKMGWDSPWGKGFPGWHIECTAMIFKLLGKQIDIHTGGIEHIGVHHNNEIAQAEAASGKPFVKYWLHNDHITIEGKKISKSLGNTVYLHNVVDKGYSAAALRYWFLTSHYRTPANFTWEAIEGADQALKRLTRVYLEAPERAPGSEEFMQKFYAAIANDLGTAQALGLMWSTIKNLDRATLKKIDRILGLGFSEPQEVAKLKVLKGSDVPEAVQNLLDERESARKSKDFARADELRKEIESQGFEIKDTAGGVQVVKK